MEVRPFLVEAADSPAEYKAGLGLAVARGLHELHESIACVRQDTSGIGFVR
jgi:hypothetical protein